MLNAHRTLTAKAVFLSLAIMTLSACGGGSSGGGGEPSTIDDNTPDPGGDTPVTETITIAGSPVKGLLSNADIEVYSVSTSSPTRAKGFQSIRLHVGRTNERGQIVDLDMLRGKHGPAIFKAVSNENTIDLTSGDAPVIGELIALLDREHLDAPVYATPISTLAYYVAVENAGLDRFNGLYRNEANVSTVTFTELFDAYAAATMQVMSIFAPSLQPPSALTHQPALITDATTSNAELAYIATLRGANEMVAAVVHRLTLEMNNAHPTEEYTSNQIMQGLAKDLADGTIDGLRDGNGILELGYVRDDVAGYVRDALTMTIPGTSTLITDIEMVLVDETVDSQTTGNYKPLEDGTVTDSLVQASLVTDADRDGSPDTDDNYPTDPNLQ